MKNTHDVLTALLARVTCKPGWRFSTIDDDEGFRLVVYVPCDDSRFGPPRGRDCYARQGKWCEWAYMDRGCIHCGRMRSEVTRPMGVNHYFPIPTATYNMKSWRRWVFECCRRVEDHELGEWFLLDGARPFAPQHFPGADPYTIHETQTEEEARTDQRGNVT
jgi:hypothetical protein